jgi:hypothetical protein
MSYLNPEQERKLERRQLTASISVYDVNQSMLLGTLVNVHSSGLLLFGASGLTKADHVYQLELRLPQDLAGSASLFIGVDVLWIRSDEDSEVQWSGCQVIDCSDQARQQIELLIEQYAD